MKARTRLSAAMLVAILLCSSAAWSSPILDEYYIAGTNFPVSFGASTPLIFNATGDLTYENVPTTEVGTHRLEVLEQTAGFSPTGAEVLRFQFNFFQSPDLSQGFSFSILDLDWDSGFGELDQAFINVKFGVGESGVQDATLFTTWSSDPTGLDITFATPTGVSWNSIFGGQTPTALMVDFFPTVLHVPEPSTLLLLGVGVLGVIRRRRR